jgi:hypothetical protein
MSANLLPTPFLRFTDTSTGLALVGGLIYTYAAGTSTPQATYTDSTAGTPNANPIVLNSRGECSCWLDPTLAYKIVAKDSLGNTIATYDQIKGPMAQADIVASSGSSLVGFIASGSGTSQRSVQSKLRDFVSVMDFGAKGDGVTDDTTAIQNAISASAGRTLWFPAGSYKLTSAITVPFNTTAYVDGSFTGSGPFVAGRQINTSTGFISGFGYMNPYAYCMLPANSGAAAANVAAFNTMVADCITYGVYEIFIPPGNWYVNSSLVVTAGITLRGINKSLSVIVGTANGQNLLTFTGQYGVGGGAKDLSLDYDSGVSGNIAIYAVATSSYSPDFLTIENLNISTLGSNTMSYGMLFDGTARHPVSGLQGLRDTTIKNVSLFNVNGGNMVEFRYCKIIYGKDLQLNQGTGTNTNIVISGYDALNVSAGVHLSGCIAANLSVATTSSFSYVGGAVYTSVTVTSTCADGLIVTCGGPSVSNTGTNVRVL